MQGLKYRLGRRILLLLLLAVLPLANGKIPSSCKFPEAWSGQWFQSGKQSPVTINATSFGDKTCIENKNDMYSLYDTTGDNCYRCLIINDRHVNVIQFREGVCSTDVRSLDVLCESIWTDDNLYTMFRLNPEPIPCPFSGASYTFTYNRGQKECTSPVSYAESCSDSSKLLLKYQACPDIPYSESTTEELQCLATWKDGRDKYLVGTLKQFGRNAATNNEDTFRCFLYEKSNHHQGEKVAYQLAQSGDSTCAALTAVTEGSRTIKLVRVDKERSKCKYPPWITKHHAWHSVDSTRAYHFTSGNATLKITGDKHEQRIVCHNRVNESSDGQKVMLVAHVTSGCEIGYVCMIFHRRNGKVIELQESSIKTIIPEEACQQANLSSIPYITLITSTPEKRKCPLPGRYRAIGYVSPYVLSSTTPRRQRKETSLQIRDTKIQRAAEKRTYEQRNEDEPCNVVSDIKIGCDTPDQSEMIITYTCEDQLVYSCHDSWEEDGVWYTIVSQKSRDSMSEPIETLCFSMRWANPPPKLPGGRGARLEQQEQELWLSQPAREFQRGATDQWSGYRLASQGMCEDLTRASATSSSSMSRVSLVLSAGAAILCKLLSR
ncbi:uncharacterized protein [Chelonus insularis]|uniref:uncharacterized protein isoform X2 n=1 Tax=Chelonus insularis TaxID=460826 RepID=UPI001588B610|nr:uncharacterized protein LOC118071579 isoform X2 [Chelonus insularis]